MKYIAFVGTEGVMPEEALKTMNEAWPAYEQELARRRVWSIGRELDLPEDGVMTVRSNDGKVLVTDGPFADTKEFVAGFGLFECKDLDEVLEIQSLNPVARFNPFEIRAFAGDLHLGPQAAAFARSDDAAGRPYLLSTWVDGDRQGAATAHPDAAVQTAWRNARGDAYILGGRLAAHETAVTTRFVDGELRVSDGSFLSTPAFISRIDVITCADLQQAAEIAATHPSVEYHALEVRPFYGEAH